MNNCHPCIRSVLLPMYPLDMVRQRIRYGEGLASQERDSYEADPSPIRIRMNIEPPSPARGRGHKKHQRTYSHSASFHNPLRAPLAR